MTYAEKVAKEFCDARPYAKDADAVALVKRILDDAANIETRGCECATCVRDAIKCLADSQVSR